MLRRARTRAKALEFAHDLSLARGGSPLFVLVRSAGAGYPVAYVVIDPLDLPRLRALGYRRLARVQSLLPRRAAIARPEVTE